MNTYNNENSSGFVNGFPIPNFDDIDDNHEVKEITDEEKKKLWAPNINRIKRELRNQNRDRQPLFPISFD